MFNLEQIAAYGYALLDDAVVDAETFLSALYLLSLNLPMAPSFDMVGKLLLMKLPCWFLIQVCFFS